MLERYVLPLLLIAVIISCFIGCGLAEVFETLIRRAKKSREFKKIHTKNIEQMRRHKMFFEVQANIIPEINKKSL